MPRWEPPTEQIIDQPKPRRWPVVVLLLGLLGVALAGLWMIYRRRHAALRGEALPVAMNVHSDLATADDSLQVIVELFAITTFVAFRLAFAIVNDSLGVLPDAELYERASVSLRDAVDFGRPVAHV